LNEMGEDGIMREWRNRIRDEMVAACLALVARWMAATADDSSRIPTPAILAAASAAARLDPFDETATRYHIELLARSGRIADASRVFHRLRELLDTELGLVPSQDLVRLHANLVSSPT